MPIAERRVTSSWARRFGYGDPPYPKRSRLYVGHPDYAGEVDQRELVLRLEREFPDGWALSTSAEALPAVLEHCPQGVRVAAWVRGERAVPALRPLSSWEPVIYFGGREYLTPVERRRVDSLVAGVSPRLTDPGRVIGAKPAAFAYWMFNLLGALPGDEVVDLFPGSGGIARAWAEVNRRAHQVSDGSAVATHDGSGSAASDGSAAAGHDGSGRSPHDGSLGDWHDGSAVDEHDGSADVEHDGWGSAAHDGWARAVGDGSAGDPHDGSAQVLHDGSTVVAADG